MPSLQLRLAAAFDTLDMVSVAKEDLPLTIDQAENVRDSAAACLGEIAAWKLGATMPSVRSALGLSSAFFGVIPSFRLFGGGAQLNAIQARLRGVECEYGFRLARDVRAGDDKMGVRAFRELFASVHPAIEIPGTRFERLGCYGGLGLVADFGAAGALVVGKGRALDEPSRLDKMRVHLRISGDEVAEGCAGDIDDGAFGPLREFVRSALARGYSPKAGQIVVTGSCSGYVVAPEGAEVVAEFRGLDASVSVRFAEAHRASGPLQ